MSNVKNFASIYVFMIKYMVKLNLAQESIEIKDLYIQKHKFLTVYFKINTVNHLNFFNLNLFYGFFNKFNNYVFFFSKLLYRYNLNV